MKRKEWALLVSVLLAVGTLQVADHSDLMDHGAGRKALDSEGHGQHAPPPTPEHPGNDSLRTVSLIVRGMT